MNQQNLNNIISSATVSNIKDKSYTGKEQTQDIVVNVNGKTLEKNKDYTVKYSNNKSIGTATVTITGKGNYTGTIKSNSRLKLYQFLLQLFLILRISLYRKRTNTNIVVRVNGRTL